MTVKEPTRRQPGALASIRIDETYNMLRTMTDRELLEAVRSHFDSHSALPGEKTFREEANALLTELDAQDGQQEWMDNWDGKLENRESLALKFAETRIRETPIKKDIYAMDLPKLTWVSMEELQVPDVNTEQYVEEQKQYGQDIQIGKVNAHLSKMNSGDVRVIVTDSAGKNMDVGRLPDNFLKNNPMNVDTCSAEIELTDYTGGRMKNVKERLIVDTDKMSGDVMELADDMLSGLAQDSDLAQ